MNRSKEYMVAVIGHYEMMRSLNPKSPIFVSMASEYYKAGNIKLAEEVLDEGLEYWPELLSAQNLKAKILIDKKKYGNAEVRLKNVLNEEPENLTARVLMAKICLKKGAPTDGLKHLDIVRKMALKQNLHYNLYNDLLREKDRLEGKEIITKDKPLPAKKKDRRLLSTLKKWLNNAGKMIGEEKE